MLYLISTLASKTGLSKDTINYYLKIGLIKEISRDPQLDYRMFDDSVAERIDNINKLKKKGHSLKKIKTILGG